MPNSKKTGVPFTFYIPSEIHRIAKVAAKLDHRSMSQYFVAAIEERNAQFLEGRADAFEEGVEENADSSAES